MLSIHHFYTIFTLPKKPVITKTLGTDKQSLLFAAQAIQQGQLVAFPTETVYGLGANAYNEDAVTHIFRVKQRPADNPLIVHIHTKKHIESIAVLQNTLEEKLIDAFMPGPFSLVMTSKGVLAPSVSPKQTTLCIRIPDHPIAQQVLSYANVPIAAPSANRSGRPSPTTAAMVYDDLHGMIPYIIDGGASVYGIESTVVKVENDTIYILRPGFITQEDITHVVGNHIAIHHSSSAAHAVHAPGIRYTHYAPKQPILITHDPVKDIQNYLQKNTKAHIALMITKETYERIKPFLTEYRECVTVYVRGSLHQLSSCAASLYQLYHTIEKTAATVIFVEALPETGLGLSIMNRVKKSAGL